jgi:predicted Zn-dependent protease
VLLLALLTLAAADTAVAQNLPDLGGMMDKVDKVAKVAKDAPGPEQEKTLGRQWASVIVGAAKLCANPIAQNYVNDVGRWLTTQTERAQIEWRFGVLDSDNVNAFATPGGYIFITRGLLLRLHNEAELAGVLAHEIAHVVRFHHIRAMQNEAGMKAGGSLLSEYTVAKTPNPEITAKIVGGIKEVLVRGLDRADEYEADRMAVVIAARAGYDPYGLPTVLHMLGGLSPQRKELGLLFATHPTPNDRLEALEKTMTPQLEAFAGQERGEARFKSKLFPAASAPAPKKRK